MSILKTLFITLFLFSAVFSQATEEDGVLVLTDANFDETIKQYQFVLVEFYAPWCGHCKQLTPEYASAAKELKSADPAIPLGKVDATQNDAVAKRFGVKGYPTLKFFVDGKDSEYTGGRKSADIVAWCKKKSGPASTLRASAEEVEAFKSSNKVAVVFFGEAGSPQFEVYENVARDQEDVLFSHVFSADVAKALNAEVPSVVLFKNFDEGRNDYKQDFTAESLKTFIGTNSMPTIIPFDQASAQKIFGEHLATLFLMTNNDSADAVEALNVASKDLKGKILMSTSVANEGLGKRLADYIGVKDSETPTVRLVVPSEQEIKKYIMSDKITAENLVKFVADWQAGTLKPVYKSAEVPAEALDNGVRVLVGKNFNEVVYDETKDVLVEFYAPWCGHCKSLAPIYESLAKKLAVNPNIVIAKCDATENEIEGMGIQGFPTLKFFPTNKKSTPLDYSGGRDEAGFLTYLKEKATVAWVDVDSAAAEGEKNKDEL